MTFAAYEILKKTLFFGSFLRSKIILTGELCILLKPVNVAIIFCYVNKKKGLKGNRHLLTGLEILLYTNVCLVVESLEGASVCLIRDLTK